MFDKIFAKSVNITETEDIDSTHTESPLTEPPLDAYKPRKTSISEISYITSILASRHFNICAGVIIGRRYVLTAADCVNEYRAETIFVKDTSKNDTKEYIIVKNIIYSEIYSER